MDYSDLHLLIDGQRLRGEGGRTLRKAADLLRERVEPIARLATIEEGKALAEARVELNVSADIMEWYAEEGRRAYGRVLPQRTAGMRMTVVKEPVGPVAGFAPWNFPLGNPTRKLAAALAAGCGGHEAHDDGTGRSCAGGGVRRRGCRCRAGSLRHREIPQRRPGVRVTDALLRARGHLRAFCAGLRRAREENAGGQWPRCRRAHGTAGA